MKLRHRYVIVPTFLALITAGIPACQQGPPANERWVATANTNVAIDWDAVGKAYQEAEGPADFERRVNEIYTGDEIISVSVVDKDDTTQIVTGFFDKNSDGIIGADEKVFEITRNITGEGANYQIAGHGHYYGYHSPMFAMASGMLIGSMMAGSMRPGYASTRYVTSPAQRGQLANSRAAYRQANPSRFPAKASQTGRSYGNRGSDFGQKRAPAAPARRSGGARFGLDASTRDSAPRRLDA